MITQIYGSNSTLYNLPMKVFPLLSRIFVWCSPVCFAVKKIPSENSIYLSVSSNDTGIKSEIYGIMWQVAHKSKIQLVCCELSPKYLLGISALKYICAIESYIFCDSLWSVIFFNVLPIFVDLCARVLVFSMFQWTLLS